MPARLSQHFLVSPEVADAIVDAADVRPDEAVVEIGPGQGMLTERLLDRGCRLTAVELDKRLAAMLDARWPGRGLKVVQSDWLKLDLDSLPSPCAVVSNLPYAVATPILQRLLDWPGCERAVLMFQKEVAERILAGPGTRKYSPLSLSVRLKADARPVCAVPRTCFRPRPKVESAVVHLTRLLRPRLPENVTEREFFRVVKAAFSQRRKTAAKALSGVLGIERARVADALREAGIAPKARAENVSLEQFTLLAASLRPAG